MINASGPSALIPGDGPGLDHRAQPQTQSTAAQIDDGPRHAWMPLLIGAHRAAMRQSENLGDGLSTVQLIGAHEWGDPQRSISVIRRKYHRPKT